VNPQKNLSPNAMLHFLNEPQVKRNAKKEIWIAP